MFGPWDDLIEDPRVAPPTGPWPGDVDFLPGPTPGRHLAFYVQEAFGPGAEVAIEAAFEQFAAAARALGGNAVASPSLAVELIPAGVRALLSGYVVRTWS